MKVRHVVSLALAAFILVACNEEDIPQEIVDQNMIISQANAEKNAITFKNKRYPKAARVLVDSDSTISRTCRFGDGWASGKLEMADGSALAIKCQTNGTGKGFSGCLLKDEFETKDYANEEGKCSPDITSLPKFK